MPRLAPYRSGILWVSRKGGGIRHYIKSRGQKRHRCFWNKMVIFYFVFENALSSIWIPEWCLKGFAFVAVTTNAVVLILLFCKTTKINTAGKNQKIKRHSRNLDTCTIKQLVSYLFVDNIPGKVWFPPLPPVFGFQDLKSSEFHCLRM